MYEDPLAYRDQKLRGLAIAAAVFAPVPAVIYVLADAAMGLVVMGVHLVACWGLAMAGYQLGRRSGRGARFAAGMALVGLSSPGLLFLFVHLGRIPFGR